MHCTIGIKHGHSVIHNPSLSLMMSYILNCHSVCLWTHPPTHRFIPFFSIRHDLSVLCGGYCISGKSNFSLLIPLDGIKLGSGVHHPAGGDKDFPDVRYGHPVLIGCRQRTISISSQSILQFALCISVNKQTNIQIQIIVESFVKHYFKQLMPTVYAPPQIKSVCAININMILHTVLTMFVDLSH